MADDLFDNDVNGPDGEPAPLTDVSKSGARSVDDTVASEVEDLFDLAPMSVTSASMDATGDDDSEAWVEETEPAAARRSARVKHVSPGSRFVWVWVALATAVNIGVAGVVVFQFDRKASKIIEQVDKRQTPEPAPVPGSEVAVDNKAAESPARAVSPAPADALAHLEAPALVVDMHPAIVKAKKLDLQDHPRLREAGALFEKGLYTESRKKYFEVLLSAMPELDGRDVVAAKLGIARCLSREGFSAEIAKGDHK